MTTMDDMPISFSAPLAAALVDGRKTETRRFATLDSAGPATNRWASSRVGDRMWVREPIGMLASRHPDGLDLRLVTYRADNPFVIPVSGWWVDTERKRVVSRGDNTAGHAPRWRHPRGMPRYLSRMTVEMTAVRREMLHDLTDAAAIAEGATRRDAGWSLDWSPLGQFSRVTDRVVTEADLAHATPRDAFIAFWNRLHRANLGPDSWNTNRPVVVLQFRVHHVGLAAAEAA